MFVKRCSGSPLVALPVELDLALVGRVAQLVRDRRLRPIHISELTGRIAGSLRCIRFQRTIRPSSRTSARSWSEPRRHRKRLSYWRSPAGRFSTSPVNSRWSPSWPLWGTSAGPNIGRLVSIWCHLNRRLRCFVTGFGRLSIYRAATSGRSSWLRVTGFHPLGCAYSWRFRLCRGAPV